MKKYILLILALGLPVRAAQINTTTSKLTVAGQTVMVNVSPTRSTAYYRVAYDVTSKKVKALVFSVGITETVNGLYCADTYAEVQLFATANNLTGLPKDPNAK